jgi:HK97 family phage portal protein
MGALANLWGKITGRGSEKAFDVGDAADSIMGAIVSGGNRLGQRGTGAVLRSYNESPWVRKAIGQIAIDFAAVRWTAYTVKGSPKQRRSVEAMLSKAAQAERTKIIRALIAADILEEKPAHPAVVFLERGNGWHSGVGARRLMSTYLRLLGNSPAIIERGDDGLPETYLPIPSTWIEELPTAKKPFYKVSQGAWRQQVAPADMLWVRDANPADPYGRGLGVTYALGDEIATDEYAARTAKAKFENFGMPAAVVGMEGASKEAGERLMQKWDEDHRGIRKIGRPYFTGAKITVAKLDEDLKQSQFIEIREWERNTITQTIGVPPEVIGIFDNANRASAEAAEVGYAKRTLVPDLELFRSMLQVQLMPQYGDGAILAYESPVPDDKEHHLATLKAAPEWALTRNQWLGELGHEPVDGGDVYFLNASLVPVQAKAVAPDVVRRLAADNARRMPALDEAATKIAGLLASTVRAQAAPTAPALHVVPTIKVVTEAEIDPILEHLRPERLTEQLDPEAHALVDEWGTWQIDDLEVNVAFDMLSPLVAEHLENFSSTRIQGLVDATTREQLRATLVEGVRAGEGIAVLQKRVRKTMTGDIGKMRATRIARTEVLRSSNFARLEGMRQTGVINSKQWLATLDGRTRDKFPVSHMALHNNIQTMAAKFSIGSYSAMYPGDFGKPEMDINCRCTVIPYVPEVGFDDAELKEIWQKFDKRLIPFEGRYERATMRGFKDQETDILEALRNAD